MTKKRISTPFFKQALVFGLSTLCLASTQAFASAYQVNEYFNSAVSAGDAGAGGAALANDASTTYSNPAGLMRIHNPQLVVVGSLLMARPHFTGSSTWSSVSPLVPPPLTTYTETGTASGAYTTPIPALHFATCLTPGWRFGLSMMAPFGLGTVYDDDSVLRYNSTKTELVVVDLTPALAYEINNQWSIGAGVDINRASLTYKAMAGVPSLSALGLPPISQDTLSSNSARGWGYGGHVGILWQAFSCTRLGLTYHSRSSIDMNGTSKLSGPLLGGGAISTDNFKTTVVLPPFTTLSAYQDINDMWAIDGSINYTQWSNVNNGTQSFYNVLAPNPVTVTYPWHYRNTWMAALGTVVKANCQWTFRGGVHYDQSPIRNNERFDFLPDNDRYGLAVGAHYQFTKQMGFDVGWTHLWVKDASISAPIVVGTQTATPNGTYRTHADIVSGQMTIDFI